MAMQDDERRRQIVAAGGILLTITVLVCGALIGWRHLPGILGEWLGTLIGVMTTPFFLELSFAALGLTVVLMLNHWRQKRAGDELLYLEQVEEPGNLPDHAKWAIYSKPPLTGEEPSLLAQADGALAIGDYRMAAECLAALPEDQLQQPESLAIRLGLARATGKADLAEKLEARLRSMGEQDA
jgi:hypothetical protein